MNPTRQARQIQAAQRAQVECFTGMFDAALDGFEQLARLQLQVLREMTQSTSQRMRDTMDARENHGWPSLPQQAVRDDGERLTQYLQQVGRIASAMQAGISQALQQGVGRMQQGLQEEAVPDEQAEPPRGQARPAATPRRRA